MVNYRMEICVQCGEHKPKNTVNNDLEICKDCQVYMGLIREEESKNYE